MARPDRETHHPLTVDAVVRIDGTEWAIDVCAASLSPRQRTASDHAEDVLRPPLEAIAAAHGCGIRVQCVAQEGERGEVWGEDYYQCLVEAARNLAPVGIGASRTVQGGAHVEVVDQTEAPRAGVQIWIWLGKGPDLAAEMTRDLAEPFAKKLGGQLLQARLAGHPVALLIDALTPPDTGNWRCSHATVSTVEEALLRLGAWADGLDAAWFRSGKENCVVVSPILGLAMLVLSHTLVERRIGRQFKKPRYGNLAHHAAVRSTRRWQLPAESKA